MNFKLDEAYDEIDQRDADLFERDKVYPLNELDGVWPRLESTDSRCGCPKHLQATDKLFYSCYRRIVEARNGVRQRPAREIARKLAGILR